MPRTLRGARFQARIAAEPSSRREASSGPDPSARALARGSAGTIGLLFTESLRDAFLDEIAARLLAAISGELAATGRGLIQDMYAASKDNKAFLHARFGLGDDVLKPYKITIDRWLWPDVLKNQGTSVAKAKKAIADYKKAAGQPDGLAELVFNACSNIRTSASK